MGSLIVKPATPLMWSENRSRVLRTYRMARVACGLNDSELWRLWLLFQKARSLTRARTLSLVLDKFSHLPLS